MDKKTPDGKVDSTPVFADFKLDGKAVTGTAGAQGSDPETIGNGKLEGDQLTFEVRAGDGTYAIKLTVVSESQLKGEVTFSDSKGAKDTAALVFTRDK